MKKWINPLSILTGWRRDDGTRDNTPRRENLPGIYPWRRIPDVKNLTIQLKGWIPQLALLGLTKKHDPVIIYEKYGNACLNRYIIHQCIRMNQAVTKKNYKLFWTIAWSILTRSNTFFVVALHHIKPDWHRTLSMTSVFRIMEAYKKIRRDPTPNLNYTRILIPKDDGSERPLGVPTLTWRIYLHNWTNILSILLVPQISKSQHGFIPGRGTLSCWKELLTKIEDPYIYEFDLKKCFDNIDIFKTLTTIFELSKTPEHIINHFGSICYSPPKYTDKPRTQDELELMHYYSGFPQGCPFSPLLSAYAISESLCKVFPRHILYADDGLLFGYTETEIKKGFSHPLLQDYGILQNTEKSSWIKHPGTVTNPLKFLGLLLIGNKLMTNTRQHKNSPNKLTITNKSLYLHPIGTISHPTLLKKILHQLDTLSLRAHDLIMTMMKEPRTEIGAADLEELLDHAKQISPTSLERGDPETSDLTSFGWVHTYRDKLNDRTWEQFIKSKISGYLISRLYNNSFKIDNLHQDFTLRFTQNSWLGRGRYNGLDTLITVFNSSSYACRSLINMLKRQNRHMIKKLRPNRPKSK